MLRCKQAAHDIAGVDKFSRILGNRDLVWTKLVGKLLGLGGCPVVYDKRKTGDGVGQVPGYMITDGTQSVDTDATAVIRGDWARVRKSI